MKNTIRTLIIAPVLLCCSCSILIQSDWGRDPDELLGYSQSDMRREFGEPQDVFTDEQEYAELYLLKGFWENEDRAANYAQWNTWILLGLPELIATPISFCEKLSVAKKGDDIKIFYNSDGKVIDYNWLDWKPPQF